MKKSATKMQFTLLLLGIYFVVGIIALLIGIEISNKGELYVRSVNLIITIGFTLLIIYAVIQQTIMNV